MDRISMPIIRDDPELAKALRDAIERYDTLSPEQKAEHDRRQRESFARGMTPTGDPRFD